MCVSFITSLAISFGTDPYLGNEIVCCACNGENDLKCFFNKLTGASVEITVMR